MTDELIIAEGIKDITKEAMQCFKEYSMCREQEITERQRIKAQLGAINHIIDANKEIYLKQIESNMEERKELYHSAQGIIEKASEDGDVEMLKIALDFVFAVYQKTPQLGEVSLELVEKKNIM